MIAVTLHGDPYPADGEKPGRELLASYFDQAAAVLGSGEELIWNVGVNGTVSEMAWTALWLRQVILATIGQDEALYMEPPPEAVSWRHQHGWLLGHAFLSGLPPFHAEGLAICCFNCLCKLLESMVSCTGSVVLAMFGGDAAAAAAYIRAGGMLPRLLAAPAPGES